MVGQDERVTGKHVVGEQNKEYGESGRQERGEAGRRRGESEMRSARQRLGRRSYSRARARSASKPLLRARSSLLSSPSLSSFSSSPPASLFTMAPSLACWIANLRSGETRAGCQAPGVYSRVMPIVTSGMIIHLFAGPAPTESTSYRRSVGQL